MDARFGGGSQTQGCSTTTTAQDQTAGPYLLLLMGAVLLVSRRRKGGLLALVTTGLLLPGTVCALPLTPHVELPTTAPFVYTQTPESAPEREGFLELAYSYASTPLTMRRLNVPIDDVIESEHRMALALAVPILRDTELRSSYTGGFDASLVLRLGWTLHRQTPDIYRSFESGGLEDLILALRFARSFRGRRVVNGLLVEPYATIPSGSEEDFTGLGAGAAGFLVGHELQTERFRITTNLGVEYQPENRYREAQLVLLRYQAGFAVQLAARKLCLGVEFAGASSVVDEPGELASMNGVIQSRFLRIRTKLYAGSDFVGFLGDSPFRTGLSLAMDF